MNKEFTILQNAWKKSKEIIQNSDKDIYVLYEKTNQIRRQNFRFYYGNIIILTITLIGILSFFYFVAPIQFWLSHLGALLMSFGLLFRIIIEIISTIKAKSIRLDDSVVDAIESTIVFYKYRRKIHSTIMPIVLVFYTIGFYLVTPEFLLYLPLKMVILYDILYLVFMTFLLILIRKGIRKEMRNLGRTINLKKSITQ